MSEKATPTTTTTNTSSYIPSWLTNASMGAVGQAQGLPQYTPYTGPNTQAGLQPNQLQAGNQAASGAGVPQSIASMGLPGYLNALNFNMPQVSADALNQFSGSLLNGQNGAIQGSINAFNNAATNATKMNQGSLDAGLGAEGAFGGNRQALADTNLWNQAGISEQQNAANILTQAQQGATSSALSALQGNQGAAATGMGINLSGAAGVGNLASSFQGLNSQQIADLLNTGGVAQTTQSGQNQFGYNQYLEGYQIPDTQASTLASILGALPHDTTGTSTTQSEMYTNPFMQAAGLAGLGGAIYMKSDRRLKKDIQEVGCLFDGTPVYRYRYKDGDGMWMIGLMAQDLENDCPQAVFERADGLKMVDYKKATDRSALLYVEAEGTA